MYMFDFLRGRWQRQIGKPPFPRMHGMGGTLVYLPDDDAKKKKADAIEHIERRLT